VLTSSLVLGISSDVEHYQLLKASPALNLDREVDLGFFSGTNTDAGVISRWFRNLLIEFIRSLLTLSYSGTLPSPGGLRIT
jgi:hypothetical protein